MAASLKMSQKALSAKLPVSDTVGCKPIANGVSSEFVGPPSAIHLSTAVLQKPDGRSIGHGRAKP